jgi:large subunit ribosomal protein L25
VSESHIEAEPRTEFGKGAARRIRRAAKVPAVLYGHGGDPVHITLPGHTTMLALKHGGVNALLTIKVNGTEQLALPKQIQRDPIKGFLEHVDLVVVRRGEKVTVEVAVHVVGQAAPDTLISLDHPTLSVEAEATNIPTGFEVSVEGLRPGSQIHASDVQLPEGATLVTDPDALVVNVTAAPTVEQLEAELAEAEAEVGIVHEPTEEELAAEAAAAAEAGEGGEGGEGEASAPAGGAEGDQGES